MLVFLIWASADVGSNVYVKTICHSKTDEKIVALTFDDGPHAEMTPRVLDVLRKYDVKATFFLVGNKVKQYPNIVKRMVAEGHTIANHTYSHRPTFPLSCYGAVAKELESCQDIITETTGISTSLFRPPFGVTNPIIGKAVAEHGMQCIGWSVRSLDTVNPQDVKRTFERVYKRLHKGAIVLLHDRCENADVLLEMLINGILDKGYKIVSIDELLNIEQYED